MNNMPKDNGNSSEIVRHTDNNQNNDTITTGTAGTTTTSVNVPDENCSNNLFRDTPIRYLGYSNEIGESFRYQYPKYVVPSYIVAFGYCLADATSTGYHTYYNHPRKNIISDNNGSGTAISDTNGYNHEREQTIRIRRTIVGTLDTLLWQSLASVMIPGYVIHTIVKVTKYSIPKKIQLPIVITSWLPTIVGLGAIPFIVHPIDHSVDYLLDNTVRSFYRNYL